ncbi:hypothetical protein M413DRAFT_442402 [Hebeloma cylindrosporum]|uniref:F-box domain-containing protein n=1 Tax=Hebeloma cylindrosporum TaxID=76867 RepID=A0A0C3C6A7_HEBCY|nr:hypothetical protein M413DRAFT_442402 [Hebeloma cylindrosporum h7]
MQNSSDALISSSQSQHVTLDLDVDGIPQSEGAPHLPAFAFNSRAEAKVLRNLDLLGLIFSDLSSEPSSHLQPSIKRARGRKNLLRVGLTCKAFFDPAMSQLWHEMDSFLPMLRLIAKVELREGVYTTREVILEHDIQRLKLYGRWIRHIQISSFTERVSGHIYAAIARYTIGTPSCLFPSLRNLRIHSRCDIFPENFQFLPLLASSPLSTIEIERITDNYKVHLASFLHEISRQHPAENHPVSTLSLSGIFGISVLPHLKGFARISKLTLVHRAAGFYVENLEFLSNHPLLSVLELDLPMEWTRIIKPSPNNAVHAFPYIRTLALGGSCNHILGILCHVYGERLTQVNLKLLGRGAEADADILRACIFRCTTMAPMLDDLQLSFTALKIPQDLFSPLRGLKSPLRSLQVKSYVIDKHLFHIWFQEAGEWSDLEMLKLELHPSQASRRNQVDVLDLVTLPLLCTSFPKLHTLEIYLGHPDTDAAVIEPLLRSQMQSMVQTHGLVNLKILLFDHSSFIPFSMRDITLAITISRFINHFFPNLQHLDLSHHHESAYPAWRDWCRGVVEMTTNCTVLAR